MMLLFMEVQPAAISAAVQVKKMGKSVVVVSPDKYLGGLSSSGLGWTDSGKKEAIGGLAREFYHRVWRHYQSASAWKWEKMGGLWKSWARFSGN